MSGFLNDKVLSGKPTSYELKTAIAQKLTRKPVARVDRAVTHLKNVRLTVVKNAVVTYPGTLCKEPEIAV